MWISPLYVGSISNVWYPHGFHPIREWVLESVQSTPHNRYAFANLSESFIIVIRACLD